MIIYETGVEYIILEMIGIIKSKTVGRSLLENI